jgi:hypothetical protein
MPKVTVVFDVADQEVAKILMDLMKTRELMADTPEGQVIACGEGDWGEQRDIALTLLKDLRSCVGNEVWPICKEVDDFINEKGA